MNLFEYDADIGYRFIPDLKTRVATEDGGYIYPSGRSKLLSYTLDMHGHL